MTKSTTTKNINANVVYIDPITAGAMLKQDKEIREISGKKNRKLHFTHVDHLSKEREMELWVLNGSAIQFDSDGHLIDGQHRLHAVIKSGKTVPFLVVTGLPYDSFDSLDQPKKRSANQVAQMESFKYYSFVASAATKILNWDQARTFERNRAQASVREIMQFARDNQESLSESAHHIAGIGHPPIGFRVSLFTAIHFLIKAKNKEQADHFFNVLVRSQDINPGPLDEMVIRLREMLLRDVSTKAKAARYTTEYVGQMVIKVWNAYRSGKAIKSINNPDAKPITEIL